MAKLSSAILPRRSLYSNIISIFSKSCINDLDSRSFYPQEIVSRAVWKDGRSHAVDKLVGCRLVIGGSKGSRPSSSFQGNARRSGGPGKEATECICPTRALNHPRNFSDNWLLAFKLNGWLTRFNIPSLPHGNDIEAASEAATSVTSYVIFTVSVYRWWTKAIVAAVGKFFNWIRNENFIFK